MATEMITYTCSYDFAGKKHVIHVMANNEAEASRKLRVIGMTATIDGELICEGDVFPLRWLVKMRRMIGC